MVSDGGFMGFPCRLMADGTKLALYYTVALIGAKRLRAFRCTVLDFSRIRSRKPFTAFRATTLLAYPLPEALHCVQGDNSLLSP
jgi:hypothetical protein